MCVDTNAHHHIHPFSCVPQRTWRLSNAVAPCATKTLLIEMFTTEMRETADDDCCRV